MTDTLTTQAGMSATQNLPEVGKKGKTSLKARKELDAREQEVFELRRDGYTFQEIQIYLEKKYEALAEETGRAVDYYKDISGIKRAYDRYIERAPERFDVEGRREQLELAIQRAEDNYRRFNAMSKTDGIDEVERGRISDVAGRWFDRLAKLRALTDDSIVKFNFTQNNLVVSDTDLLAKLQSKITDISTPVAPNMDEFKSDDTRPPSPEIEDAEIVKDEDGNAIIDDEFLEEEEKPIEVAIPEPTASAVHEEIKPKSTASNIHFVL